MKCDGTRAETKFLLSAKRTSPFKSAGASVQSTTGSRGVRISGINVGYTMFRGSVKGTGYLLHSTVSPSLPLPCVTVCHHVSTGLYWRFFLRGRAAGCSVNHSPQSSALVKNEWSCISVSSTCFHGVGRGTFYFYLSPPPPTPNTRAHSELQPNHLIFTPSHFSCHNALAPSSI